MTECEKSVITDWSLGQIGLEDIFQQTVQESREEERSPSIEFVSDV
jgi:hypothetical protein